MFLVHEPALAITDDNPLPLHENSVKGIQAHGGRLEKGLISFPQIHY
jgi:hypothetical protein